MFLTTYIVLFLSLVFFLFCTVLLMYDLIFSLFNGFKYCFLCTLAVLSLYNYWITHCHLFLEKIFLDNINKITKSIALLIFEKGGIFLWINTVLGTAFYSVYHTAFISNQFLKSHPLITFISNIFETFFDPDLIIVRAFFFFFCRASIVPTFL